MVPENTLTTTFAALASGLPKSAARRAHMSSRCRDEVLAESRACSCQHPTAGSQSVVYSICRGWTPSAGSRMTKIVCY